MALPVSSEYKVLKSIKERRTQESKIQSVLFISHTLCIFSFSLLCRRLKEKMKRKAWDLCLFISIFFIEKSIQPWEQYVKERVTAQCRETRRTQEGYIQKGKYKPCLFFFNQYQYPILRCFTCLPLIFLQLLYLDFSRGHHSESSSISPVLSIYIFPSNYLHGLFHHVQNFLFGVPLCILPGSNILSIFLPIHLTIHPLQTSKPSQSGQSNFQSSQWPF